MKKKRQNGKRGRRPDTSKAPDPTKASTQPDDADSEPAAQPEFDERPAGSDSPADPQPAKTDTPPGETDLPAADLELDEGMIEHVRTMTSLIEEREVSREETVEMLERVMRQRSLARESRRDYVVRFLKEQEENPP